MKKLFLSLAIILLISFNSYSQVTQEWVARYNGSGDSSDYANKIAVDDLGNVYVTGYSYGSGTGRDYVTIKYNSSGIQQWEQRYNGPGNSDDGASSIAVDGAGNVYVTGYSNGSATSTDYATIKYNSSGVQQWVQRYNGSGNYAAASSIVVDNIGNVYVTGSGTDDYATIKYNSSGDSVWVQRYNGPGNFHDVASSIAVDGSGNVYVTGTSIGSGTGYDYATLKYNSSGVQQWVQRYTGPGNFSDGTKSIAVDGSGNVYVTGYSFGSGTGDDITTIKYNSSGDQQWVQRYNGPGNTDDGASSITVDASGNVYVAGGSSDFDHITIKYNSSGEQQWVSRYKKGPGGYETGASSIALDGSGNVYVTGISIGIGTDTDYATIKYNSSGDSVWVQRYNGPANSFDGAFSIALDGSGNVYVTGISTGSGTGLDYATIKYSQSVGINQINSNIPDRFSLLQNYPNPFNPTTNIEFSLPLKSYVKLKVFDITGKEVAELVNENLSAGTFRYDFNAGDLSSGLYFYKLETEKFTETKRMILLK